MSAMEPCWHVYILRCADGSLYTGITTDLDRRLAEHNAGAAAGARYTRARLPVTLVYQEAALDRAAAARREWQIKQLARADKLALLQSGRAE
jgi:putative endonuclease